MCKDGDGLRVLRSGLTMRRVLIVSEPPVPVPKGSGEEEEEGPGLVEPQQSPGHVGSTEPVTFRLHKPLHNVVFADLSSTSNNLYGCILSVNEFPQQGCTIGGQPYWRIVAGPLGQRVTTQPDNALVPKTFHTLTITLTSLPESFLPHQGYWLEIEVWTMDDGC